MAEVNKYIRVTGTAAVVTGEGVMSALHVNESITAQTLTCYDATDASGTLLFIKTNPTQGYYDLGDVRFFTGFYCLVSGGTQVNLTFLRKLSD